MSSHGFGKPPCTCVKLPPSDKSAHTRWEVDKDCPVHGAEADEKKQGR